MTGNKRSSALPEVPTISEAGVPGYYAEAWYGLLALRGTPERIVERLRRATAQSWDTPERRDKLALQGVNVVGSDRRGFTQFVASEIAKWSAVVDKSGATPE